ncbi:transglutaminase domain-containing protein [Jejuia pallidilutea]|nr:transglutaminase domain-containing protein [Jejuia pallidilutea]
MIRLFTILIFFFCIALSAQKSDFKHIDFGKADSIAKSCSEMTLKNMPLLVHQLTNNLNTQVEQFRAIHTWVCYNIESDHYFSEATLKKRRKLLNNKSALQKWNTKQQTKVFKRLVRNKKTICSGYAYVLKALTNLADIECEIVDGYARTVRTNVNTVDFPNHSWNVVKLNGKWYFADTTQTSGYYNLDDEAFVKNYNEGYFLATPELFVKNHYPLDENWLLLDEKPTLKQFVEAPIIYGSTYKYDIIPIFPTTLVTTLNIGEAVMFKFKILNKTALKDVNFVFSGGLRNKVMSFKGKNYKHNILQMAYQFHKKGEFDVHAKIDEDIIASYTIIVKNAEKMPNGTFN